MRWISLLLMLVASAAVAISTYANDVAERGLQISDSPAPQVREGYAELQGVRLWFVDTGGSGEAVVLLHANTGTTKSWANQLRAFSEAGYRAIAFDRRGWGRSMANPATGPQPSTVAEDLHNLVEYLKLDRFHLIGVAGGGFVALDYAAWHPERLITMVVAASTGSVQDREAQEFAARILMPGFASLPEQYRELGPSYRGANPSGTAEWIDIEERSQQPGTPTQPLRTPNTYAKLEKITVRTLIMAADADLYAPPSQMQMWGRHLVNAEWAMVPDSGHSIAWEHPALFNTNVLRFLKGCHGRGIRSATTEGEPSTVPPCGNQ